MKTFKYIGLTLVATTMMAASCSDFEDYNTVPTDVTASANKTLWENISADSELSDFAALVKKAGYDDELSVKPLLYGMGSAQRYLRCLAHERGQCHGAAALCEVSYRRV